ncbi:MAG: Sec-independent protein translocase subunit TatA/TatB [Niveispirillum sp.]|uniref:Sec-independent protein translocase subunit TatA/TatB n=1 Tax=Niveispirillum sp. TaxID=1917217 RepID=UPI0040371434
MGGLGWMEILVILVIVMVIFGAGKLPKVMGDLGQGIRNFKSNLSDGAKAEDDVKTDPVPPAVPPAKPDDAPKA